MKGNNQSSQFQTDTRISELERVELENSFSFPIQSGSLRGMESSDHTPDNKPKNSQDTSGLQASTQPSPMQAFKGCMDTISGFFYGSVNQISTLEKNLENLEVKYQASCIENKVLEAKIMDRVDRHNVKTDSQIIEMYMNVMRAMALFIRSERLHKQKEYRDIVKNLFLEGMLFPVSVGLDANSHISDTLLYEYELLSNAFWKFISDELFNDLKPFSAFSNIYGNSCGDNLNRAYRKLYPKYDIEAAKWTATTIRRMMEESVEDETELNETYEFLTFKFCERFLPTSRTLEKNHKYQDRLSGNGKNLYRSLLDNNIDIGSKFRGMIRAAVEFSKVCAGERAQYSLIMARLDDQKQLYWKDADDEHFSTELSNNISDQAKDSEGRILLVASPCLVKWGTGLGAQLDKYNILIKAIPHMAERQSTSSDIPVNTYNIGN